MIESIAALHLALPPDALAAVPAAAPAPPPAAMVTQADQVRFQVAMQGVAASPATAAGALPLPSEAVTPGDRILGGMERLRGHYRGLGAELDTLATRSDLTAMDLIGIQMQVAQVTLGAQLIGQVASKLEQNLNTLLKAQ